MGDTEMCKYLTLAAVLLIFACPNAQAWQTAKGTTLFLADGKIAHLVPSTVVRRTMDVTLATMGEMTAVEPVHPMERKYVVQVGTFAVKENAFRLESRLRSEQYVVKVWEYDSKQMNHFYVVTVGEYATAEDAHDRLGSIEREYNLQGMVLMQGWTR
jgi:cell division protein FtsN